MITVRVKTDKPNGSWSILTFASNEDMLTAATVRSHAIRRCL